MSTFQDFFNTTRGLEGDNNDINDAKELIKKVREGQKDDYTLAIEARIFDRLKDLESLYAATELYEAFFELTTREDYRDSVLGMVKTSMVIAYINAFLLETAPEKEDLLYDKIHSTLNDADLKTFIENAEQNSDIGAHPIRELIELAERKFNYIELAEEAHIA